jgi:hypothetical protein
MSRRYRHGVILWGLVLAVWACEGNFSVQGDRDVLPDAPPDGITDGADPAEGTPDTPFETDGADAADLPAESDADAAVDPLPDLPDDSTSEPDPTDPCAAVTCWDHSHCVSGRCVCDDGYVDMGGVCREPDPGDPEARTEDEVCARWRADYPALADWVWNEGAATCDPGDVNDTARHDGVRRINLFRWLCGLGPVDRNVSVEDGQQACAVMMLRNGTLNHSPPPSWECYTAEGAAAAGSSNLAMGAHNPAGAVDQYIQDWGNATTMGHRRWILYPPYSSAGIGQAGNYNCLHVFAWGGTYSRPWVAFPAQGFYPVQGVLGVWTFSGNDVGSSTVVSVTRESDGTDLAVTPSLLSGGYGLPTVSFDPGEAEVGETYIVTVTGAGDTDITYRVRIIDCS